MTQQTMTSTPGAHAMQRRFPLPLAEHPNLELVSDSAQITLVPLDPDEPPFLELLGRDGERVLVDIRAEADTTRVRIDTGLGPLAFGVRARVVVHVPAALRGRVRSSAGTIHAERLEGCSVVLETDFGAISLDDVHGAVRASTQAGRIDGEDLQGSFDISSTAGAVRLQIAELAPGTHRIHTSVGAIKVDLARGMNVNIKAKTELGAARVEYPSDPRAAAVLELNADIGTIKVRESYRQRGASTPPRDDRDVESILHRVAEGALSPKDASSMLRKR